MAQEEYGKRVKDLTVEQLEARVHKAITEATPPDAIQNMPIGEIEQAQAAALSALGFIDIQPKIKLKLVCTLVYPPIGVKCRLELTVDF